MTSDFHSKHGSCRLCGSTKLQCVVPLLPIPLGEHYSSTPLEESERFPIDLYQCMDCSAVQTQDNISNDFLWKDYTYFSGQTTKIIEHFNDVAAELISTYFPESPPNVLDIGSNDGSLLQSFKNQNCSVQGIDPASTVVDVALKQGIPTELGLFDLSAIPKLKPQAPYQLITAFNVFAHSSSMDEMLDSVCQLLAIDGVFCFEVQYLADIVQKNILGTVFHEHMIHYSYQSASRFVESRSLEIINAYRNNIQNGSIIFVVSHKKSTLRSSQKNAHVLQNLSELESSLSLDNTDWSSAFNKQIQDTKHNVARLLDRLDKAFLPAYGAARSGPTLAIQYGFDKHIECLFDDHPSKLGFYSPFNKLPVLPSSSLNSDDYPYCLILAYIHAKPIIKKHIDYLRSGGTFVIVWPSFLLVTADNIDSFSNVK